MPDYSLSTSQIKRIDEAPPSLKLEKIQVDLDGGRSAPKDFLSELGTMVDGMDESQAAEADSIELAAIDAIDLDSLKAAAGQDRPTQLLSEATQLIQQEQYAEALPLLDELMEMQPGHHEGAYLSALCLSHVGNHMDALRALRPLRELNVSNRLAVRIGDLRARIRKRMLAKVMIGLLLQLRAGGRTQAIDELRELVELDPESSMYHYILAGTLMTDDRLGEALAAADAGVRHSPPNERGRLSELREQISERLAREQLKPARGQYLRGRFPQARKLLHGTDKVCQETPLCRTFDGYLARLDGGGGGLLSIFRRKSSGAKKGAPPIPQGDPETVDSLYMFLAEEELAAARKMLGSDDYAGAETALQGMLERMPAFPFGNFLYAYAIYSKYGVAIGSSKPPPIEEVVANLRRAHKFAVYGAQDKDISAAPGLVSKLDEVLAAFGKLEKEIGKRRAEAKIFNKAAEEFGSIMEAAKDGISSPQQFRGIKNRMAKLHSALPGLTKQLKSDDAREGMAELTKAVKRNFDQLKSMEAGVEEAEQVKDLMEAFGNKMESINKGTAITSRSDVRSTQRFFRDLVSQIDRARSRVKSSEARKALDQLRDAVNGVLGQLDAI